MPCPTCDHTMQCLSVTADEGKSIYWCPRCGTVKTCVKKANEAAHEVTEPPKLVKRCRQFEKQERDLSELPWVSLGIAEAINLPADRPT